MRIIHALCSAYYTGRGDTHLPYHERVIIMKSDGSITIHSDTGTKPLNYMGVTPKPTITEENNGRSRTIRVENTKESLLIECTRVFTDIMMDIPGDDPGLIRDGTEEQVHSWLSDNLNLLDPELLFVTDEYDTGNGPVDILAERYGEPVLVEVKRVATVAALHQLKRYQDGCGDDREMLLVAIDVRPKTRERAENMGIKWWQLSKTDTGYDIAERSDETVLD